MQREATRAASGGLDRLHYCFDFRHLELTRCLDSNMCRNAVLDDQCKALTTHAHPETRAIQYEIERFRVVPVAVGKHQHGIANVAIFAPGVHNENVIDGHAGHRIDALCLERLSLFYEARQVVH